MGSCAHIAAVLLGMGVDPEERKSFTIDESVALTAENFMDWDDDHSGSSDAGSPPLRPRNAERSQNV